MSKTTMTTEAKVDEIKRREERARDEFLMGITSEVSPALTIAIAAVNHLRAVEIDYKKALIKVMRSAERAIDALDNNGADVTINDFSGPIHAAEVMMKAGELMGAIKSVKTAYENVSDL